MTEVVGRASEIAGIIRWFEEAAPTTLLLEGPPGLGKTTVWLAVTEELRARGAHVATSAPTEAESGLSYAGLADLLAPAFARVRPALPEPQAAAIAIALRLEAPGSRLADDTAVARGTLEALRALGREGAPVLLAIDDLRWLDAPSLAVIGYVARRLAPMDGVRILTTHRSDAPRPDILDRGLAYRRMELGPMSVGGIHRIVRLHTGISLPRPRLLEIHALALGNPLHAVELARAVDTGLPTAPDSLTSLFATRIAASPKPASDALILLAASADRGLDRLSQAWSVWHERKADASFGEAIRPALDAGLVEVAGSQVRAVHPLITHVAYERAEPGARRAAHRALAETAPEPEERARHLGRSVDGPDAAVADVIEAAAGSGGVRSIRAVSATLFERAAELTPTADAEAAGRRRLAAAATWYEAGDTHRVERLLEPMVEGWPDPRQRAEARWRLGTALDEAGRWPAANDLWRAALADTDDRALTSQIRCSLAITALYTDSVNSAVDWSSAAVEDAEASRDRASLARSLAVHAFIGSMGGLTDVTGQMDRALAIEATVDEHLGEWSPAALAAECARHTGDVESALEHYATVLDRASARGDANVEQWAAFGLASAAIQAGQIDRASELADLVLDIADQTDVMRIPARSLRAHVDAFGGDHVRARAIVAEAVDMAIAAGETMHLFGTHLVLGTIEFCAGNMRVAAAAFHDARVLADELAMGHATALRNDLHEAEAAAHAGELAQSDDALAAFATRAGASPPAWSIPVWRRAVAARHAADGELEAAIVELRAAIADATALPPDIARAWLGLAAVQRRARHYRDARDAAEAARQRFTQLGMPTLVAAAEEELGRVPGRRTPVDGVLTASEARVAALVAAGHTNRNAALELTLSVKTIEVTLTRVYAKLGVRSRTELAAHFRDLAAPPKM